VPRGSGSEGFPGQTSANEPLHECRSTVRVADAAPAAALPGVVTAMTKKSLLADSREGAAEVHRLSNALRALTGAGDVFAVKGNKEKHHR